MTKQEFKDILYGIPLTKKELRWLCWLLKTGMPGIADQALLMWLKREKGEMPSTPEK